MQVLTEMKVDCINATVHMFGSISFPTSQDSPLLESPPDLGARGD